MQKYIEINCLQDIIQFNVQPNYPYVSGTKDAMINCHLQLYSYHYIKIISAKPSFIENLLLQNDNISVSIIKKYIIY